MASTIQERERTQQLEIVAQPPRKSLSKIIALGIIEEANGLVSGPFAALTSEIGERAFGFVMCKFAQDVLLAESRGDIVLTREQPKENTIKLLEIYQKIDQVKYPRRLVSFFNYLKRPEKIPQPQMV